MTTRNLLVPTLVVPALLVGLFACTSTSTSTATPSTADGGANEDGTTTPGASDPATDAGAWSETGAAAPLTGDVWVDADGKAIGIARTIPDLYGKATQALIDADGIAWLVVAESGEILPFDRRGVFFYANDDCTGARWVGNGGYYVGLPDVGVTTTLGPNYDAIFAIKPNATSKPLTDFASYDDPRYGCQSQSFPSSPVGYADSDVLTVTAPTGFTVPFHVERR